MIHLLDLDGTATFESLEAVGIAMDGSTDDEVSHSIRGDYNHIPFPANTFDEIRGVCYLEGSDRDSEIGVTDFTELYRVAKPGCTIYIGECGHGIVGDPKLSPEWEFSGPDLLDRIQEILLKAQAAGLKFVGMEEGGNVEEHYVYKRKYTTAAADIELGDGTIMHVPKETHEVEDITVAIGIPRFTFTK